MRLTLQTILLLEPCNKMEANPDNFRNEKAYFKCDPGQILVRNVYSIKQQYTFDISIKILVKKITNINYILHFVFRYQNGHLIIY